MRYERKAARRGEKPKEIVFLESANRERKMERGYGVFLRKTEYGTKDNMNEVVRN